VERSKLYQAAHENMTVGDRSVIVYVCQHIAVNKIGATVKAVSVKAGSNTVSNPARPTKQMVDGELLGYGLP
jgi:hypothetical protein